MTKENIEVGDIRPIYNITGFQVCKTLADNPDESEWTPVKEISQAEILSFIYQYQKPAVTKKIKKVKKNQKVDDEIAKLQNKIKDLEEDEEPEEPDQEINDEDL